MTEIIPGQFKGPAFKKGHVVTKEDIPHLRRLGKEHIYVLDLGPGEVHEDDAAYKLADAMAGSGVVVAGPPSEGKIALLSAHRGLMKVDAVALTEMCMIPEICCASRHTNTVLEKGEKVADTRAIPLIIDVATLNSALDIARNAKGIFRVLPFSRPETGIVVTGNEVYSGLINDKFAPTLRKKMAAYDCSVTRTLFVPDKKEKIVSAIKDLLDSGVGLILISGGMSVDPDDVSRLAIAEAGAEDIVYGTPVLPGAMFLYGHIGDVPVLGLPACVLYFKTTVFDLILPRVLAGEVITRRDLAAMAHGGLCLGCERCHFPACPFGKSV
jgi:molybdenum cofactor synthesis domain-containing protein